MPTDLETRFAAWLAGLAEREDRAALAHLRRGLGKPPGTAPEMFPHVVPWTQTMPDWQADLYYLVAALFALDPRSSTEGNFGDTCRRTHRSIRSDRGGGDEDGIDSLEHRFVALLNAHPEDLPEHLRHAVALADSHDVGVNWAQLLHDLRYWSHPDRFVQRQWANSYWGGRTQEGPAEDEAAS